METASKRRLVIGLLSNKEKWEKWIPIKTACRPSDGLVDRRFNFVSTRQAAVDCGLCLPGHFSEILVDHLGQTRRCSQCSAGRSQRLSGATSCVDCAAGRFTAEPGQSECAACPLGSYSTSRGSEGCERCGQGPKWTTNRLVKVDREQRWIEVEGAASAMDCSCVAGWYLEHSTCKVCGVGTKCLGGELQLLPGYYSKKKSPGHVFQCFGSKGRCPGGLAWHLCCWEGYTERGLWMFTWPAVKGFCVSSLSRGWLLHFVFSMLLTLGLQRPFACGIIDCVPKQAAVKPDQCNSLPQPNGDLQE